MAKMSATRAAAKAANQRSGGHRVIATNRRANHEYFIEDTLETGIVLTGSEIKSVRAGKVTIGEAYIRVEDGELWLIGAHIAPFERGGYANHTPDRPRKLLAHKREIEKLQAETERMGMTIVPLKLVIRDGRAKLVIGVAKGKKLHDKRASVADREAKRDIERAMRDRG